MSFSQDLRIGGKAEDRVVEKLRKEFPTLKRVEEGKDYDLKDESGYTAEVKFDRLSEITPNVGIEYLCNSKDSGISATKAIEWIHIFCLDGEWVFARIPCTTLKAFLKSNWEYFKKVNGGDKLLAKIALVDKNTFANTFSYYKI